MTKKLVVTMFCLAAAVAQPAFAAQLGPYVGGSYGVVESQAEFQTFDDFTVNLLYPFIQFEPASPSAHVASLDTEDQGYTGLVGYRITAHLAIEGMFSHLGEVTYRATAEGSFAGNPPVVADTTIEGQASGVGLYALGIWPFGYRWEVYARGGVQFTTTGADGRFNDGNFVDAILDFGRESSTDYVAGVGVAMSIFDIYGARLEYARVFDAADGSISEGDLDLLSLGFIVAF